MSVDRQLCVIGLGYVGLPLALDLVLAGYHVNAVDTSAERLAALQAGHSYIDDIPSERLAATLETGRLVITDSDDGWSNSTVAFICVPTPLTASGEPDLGPILGAADYVARGLHPGDVVVLQSTTYPGTTMGPLKAHLEGGRLRVGVHFGLAFSPERVSPGEGRPASSIPRLVGGSDAHSTRRVVAILEAIAPDVRVMSDPDTAELAKLFENVFRNVNIALVNELALICEKLHLDVWEVIQGAATKPFGFMPFFPGPGVGGHCIPVDPYYLSARAREVGFHERFIETAGDINSRMPQHVVELITTALNSRRKSVRGAVVLIIGVAFKPDVSDGRNSPAASIIESLTESGAIVQYHDPRLQRFNPSAEGSRLDLQLESVDLRTALEERPDCVVIVTSHKQIDWDSVFAVADLVVDTRNVSSGRSVKAGQVLRLGAGWS